MGLGEMTVNFRVPFALSVSPILMPRNVVIIHLVSSCVKRVAMERGTCRALQLEPEIMCDDGARFVPYPLS